MQIKAANPEGYIQKIPKDRVEVFTKLRQAILDNLPTGFEETMNYGMIGYVVPHSVYPDGYHCKPSDPLPFANIASQKNFVAFYHMGLYAKEDLMQWFVSEYQKQCKYKLDMGKSCVRFKKMDDIPFELIGQLISKMSSGDWIKLYEEQIKKSK